jgi:hypothetical protein
MMSAVAVDFVDKAYLPALQDHFPALIAVAHDRARPLRARKHQASP